MFLFFIFEPILIDIINPLKALSYIEINQRDITVCFSNKVIKRYAFGYTLGYYEGDLLKSVLTSEASIIERMQLDRSCCQRKTVQN